MATTLLHGATLPTLYLQHSVFTARGFAPGHKTLGPYRVVIGRYSPIFMLYVGPWPLQPRDMSTITTMSTIIITTTITTTLHKCILNTYGTGEKS